MHTHDDAAVFEFVYQLSLDLFLVTVCRFKCHIDLARSIDQHLDVLIYIAICVTRNGDRLFPCTYSGSDTVQKDRRSEYCSVKYRSYSPVWALPHLFEIILFHSLLIGRYRGALYCHTIFFGGFSSLDSYPIVCFIAFLKAQIVVFCFQVDIRIKEDLLDLAPYHPCHFISVHLNQRRLHLNSHVIPTFCFDIFIFKCI